MTFSIKQVSVKFLIKELFQNLLSHPDQQAITSEVIGLMIGCTEAVSIKI